MLLWGDSRTSLLNFWLISHEINLSFEHSHLANVLIYHQGFSEPSITDCSSEKLVREFLVSRINLKLKSLVFNSDDLWVHLGIYDKVTNCPLILEL